MAEELLLPKLSWNPATESFSTGAARKRVRSSPPISSDPAIFSSDDDPSADNYTQERRKKKYRGPWYMQRLASDGLQESIEPDHPKKTKRPFERQFDSGVFMGSDGTDMEDGPDEVEGINDKAISGSLPARKSWRMIGEDDEEQCEQSSRQLSAEEIARQHIELCLDEGNERIDLSSKSLTTLSNATIRPLATFTRVPSTAEAFHKLEPKLKLFLSSNRLRSLPGELFNLERLTFLTLRDNEIHEVPPSIGKLINLRELNLSMNGLRYLPYEILNLFTDSSQLSGVHLHPNLFHEPQFPRDTGVEEVQFKIGLGNRARSHRPQVAGATPYITNPSGLSWHKRWKVNYQARTDIRYFDITGKLVKGPAFPSVGDKGSETSTHSIPVVDIEDTPQPPSSRGDDLSRSPSLIEVALSSCIRSPQLPFLADMLPRDGPQYLFNILADAAIKKESGGSTCTICRRNMVLPRTEWIEWWEIDKCSETGQDVMAISAASPLRQMENDRDISESMVPLIRRGCSWLCVPVKLVKWQLQEDGDV